MRHRPGLGTVSTMKPGATACVDGNAIASSQKVFPRPRLSAALLLRAASTLDADRQLSLVTTGLASHLSKCAPSGEDGSDDERDERQACDERAMLILRRPAHAMPWLKRGRVGRYDASRWCCVVGLVAARHGSTNDAKRPVEVVLEEAPRWNVRRVPASSIRLTGVVVTLAEDLSRPGNVDACRRATLEALEALQRKDSTKKKKKRRVALFLDELDVIEVKDEADAASYRSLTARAAVLKRRDGDELSESERSGALEARLRARVPTGLSSSEEERQGREAVAQGLAQAGPCPEKWRGDGRGFGGARLRRALRRRRPGGARRGARVLSRRRRGVAAARAGAAVVIRGARGARVSVNGRVGGLRRGRRGHDPTAHADDRRAFAAARAAVEAAARSVGRACGDDALVAEELAVLSARPRAGLPSPVDLLHALAAGADAAADGVFAGRLREAAAVCGGGVVVCIKFCVFSLILLGRAPRLSPRMCPRSASAPGSSARPSPERAILAFGRPCRGRRELDACSAHFLSAEKLDRLRRFFPFEEDAQIRPSAPRSTGACGLQDLRRSLIFAFFPHDARLGDRGRRKSRGTRERYSPGSFTRVIKRVRESRRPRGRPVAHPFGAVERLETADWLRAALCRTAPRSTMSARP